MTSFARRLGEIVRRRSFVVALALWLAISVTAIALCHGSMPLPLGPNPGKPTDTVVFSSIALLFLALEIGLVALITRRRSPPDLAARAPAHARALREVLGLWVYGALVLVAGRVVGIHFFGEGIALHLNGSLVGATRVQSPSEVYTWAAYNGILLALIPYIAFRMRGYSDQQLNLRSDNRKSDALVIAVVLVIGCLVDFAFDASFFQLSHHQQFVGGLLTFVLHLFGTDLPIMIFIYSILLPRYARLFSPFTAFLLGAASYPAMHVFESWTRYDSPAHSVLSVCMVFLFFFPPGVMKSFLTWRTGNAWVHVWAFHAITPHVTVDTRLIVRDFNIP